MGDETIVQVNGVDICVATFGDRGDPAILLIGGAGSSMDWWEDEFCSRLAAGLRFVIRYDSRDTGRSVSYQPGAPQYTVEDLAATRWVYSMPSRCQVRTSSGSLWAGRSRSG